MTFQEKLAALYERFAYAQKSGENAHFRYKFVREADLKRELNRALRELGLGLDVFVDSFQGDGKACVVKLRLTITNRAIPSDADAPYVVSESVVLEGVGGGMDSGDKAPAKAMQAAFKYALLCGLSVETGEDSEADAETDEAAARGLLARIDRAETLGELAALKPEVAQFRESAKFAELVAAYKVATARVADAKKEQG